MVSKRAAVKKTQAMLPAFCTYLQTADSGPRLPLCADGGRVLQTTGLCEATNLQILANGHSYTTHPSQPKPALASLTLRWLFFALRALIVLAARYQNCNSSPSLRMLLSSLLAFSSNGFHIHILPHVRSGQELVSTHPWSAPFLPVRLLL